MKSLFKKDWFHTWIFLNLIGFVLSAMSGLYYFFFAALLVPCAQTIGLFRIQHSGRNLIWLIHTPLLFFILIQHLNPVAVILLIVAMSLWGELLLLIIFKRWGRMAWFYMNTIGLLLLFIIADLQPYKLTWGSIAISLAGVLFYAILTGIGLYFAFLRTKESK